MKLIDLLESNLSPESNWGHNHFLLPFGKTEQMHNMNYFQFSILSPSTNLRENSCNFVNFLTFDQSSINSDYHLSLTQIKFWVMWASQVYRKIRALSVFPLVQRAFLFFVVASCRRTFLLAKPAGFFKTLKSTHFLPSLWKTFKLDKSWAYL